MVHVQHGGLGAFEEHDLVVVQRVAEDEASVRDVRLQPLAIPQVLLGGRGRVDAAAVVDLGEQLVLVAQDEIEFLAEDAGVEQVLDPYPHAGDLVRPRYAGFDEARGRWCD